MKSNTCPKCDSEWVEGIHVTDSVMGSKQDIAAVYRDPTAWLFKGMATTPIEVRACSDCGYMEFYAANPSVLHEAASQHK